MKLFKFFVTSCVGFLPLWAMLAGAPLKAQLANKAQADEWIQRGKVAFDKTQWEVASDDFTKAINASPRYALAYLWRGTTYKMQAGASADHKTIAAIVVFYGKAQHDFKSAAQYAAQGSADARDAATALKKLATERTTRASELEKKGRSELKAGRARNAMETAGDALDLDPRLSSAYILRGDAAYRVNWQMVAQQAYETYLKKAPKGAQALYAQARLKAIARTSAPPKQPIQVFWNNAPLSLPVAPLERGGALYLPLDAVLEKLEMRKEGYDAVYHKIIYSRGPTRLELQFGVAAAEVITQEGRRRVALNQPLFEYHLPNSGRQYAMIELRFFKEALGVETFWSQTQRQLNLVYTDKNTDKTHAALPAPVMARFVGIDRWPNITVETNGELQTFRFENTARVERQVGGGLQGLTQMGPIISLRPQDLMPGEAVALTLGPTQNVTYIRATAWLRLLSVGTINGEALRFNGREGLLIVNNEIRILDERGRVVPHPDAVWLKNNLKQGQAVALFERPQGGAFLLSLERLHIEQATALN